MIFKYLLISVLGIVVVTTAAQVSGKTSLLSQGSPFVPTQTPAISMPTNTPTITLSPTATPIPPSPPPTIIPSTPTPRPTSTPKPIDSSNIGIQVNWFHGTDPLAQDYYPQKNSDGVIVIDDWFKPPRYNITVGISGDENLLVKSTKLRFNPNQEWLEIGTGTATPQHTLPIFPDRGTQTAEIGAFDANGNLITTTSLQFISNAHKPQKGTNYCVTHKSLDSYGTHFRVEHQEIC